MKKLFMMLTFGAIMMTGCQCFDCGSVFEVTPRQLEFYVSNGEVSGAETITVSSSYSWTTQWANASDADKFNLSVTSGAPGLTVLTVTVTQVGIDTIMEDLYGSSIIATINFIPSQGESVPVEIFLLGPQQ